jgi:drug/metabolite transporter (DMT)-like permease
MALAAGYIDAWSFTAIRLLSAAVCLGIIMVIYSYNLKRQPTALNNAILKDKGSWLSSLSLLIYALCFSLAYVQLDTGTGALILFAAVQLTMIGWGIYQKEQLSAVQWTAFVVAVAGFVYLMLPSAAVPSLSGAVIMATSGIAWGIYSIRGKACVSPLRATGFNFIRSLLAVPILLLLAMSHIKDISIEGILLASLSGALTSAIGYSIWYMAMPLLKSTQAAVVQFCVPVLATMAGVILLSEQLTMRFIIASTVILAAVLVFIFNKKTVKQSSQPIN